MKIRVEVDKEELKLSEGITPYANNIRRFQGLVVGIVEKLEGTVVTVEEGESSITVNMDI